jgi:hypothetical protein
MNHFFAKGRPRQKPGQMNRLEEKYAAELLIRKQAGEVIAYWFEGIKLKLADRTFFTPDFFVLLDSGFLEVHEVKGGFFEDDARVKIKVAAEQFPFRFIVVRAKPKREGGGWEMEEI